MVMMAVMMLINHEMMALSWVGTGGLLLIIALTASKGPVVVRGVDGVDMVEREQDGSCQSVMLKIPQYAICVSS